MECVKVVVEIPKGSRNKYERNPETGEFELDRRLWASVAYPTEYGFVAETKAGDGDELDALVAVTEPTFTGCVIWARPVALLRMRSEDGDDPKVFSFLTEIRRGSRCANTTTSRMSCATRLPTSSTCTATCAAGT